jgi:hypothetical protein
MNYETVFMPAILQQICATEKRNYFNGPPNKAVARGKVIFLDPFNLSAGESHRRPIVRRLRRRSAKQARADAAALTQALVREQTPPPPCPFCGKLHWRFFRDLSTWATAVECLHCMARGPLCIPDEGEALSAWADRVSPK